MKEAILFVTLMACGLTGAAQTVDTFANATRPMSLYDFYSDNRQNERFFPIGKSALFINQQPNGYYEFIELKPAVLRDGDTRNAVKHGIYYRLNTRTNEMVVSGQYWNNAKDGQWVYNNPDSTIRFETWKRGKLKETQVLKPVQ